MTHQQPPAPGSTARNPSAVGERSGNRAGTSIRESARVRDAQQSEGVVAEAQGHKQADDQVEMRATVNVAVHDAVNELVGSNVFLKTISSLVTKKTFERSVAEASKKVPVDRHS